MTTVNAYATAGPKDRLKPFQMERREPGAHDVVIDIHYCGVCHSDVHQARDEWGGSKFPMVPGHEIVGKVIKVGSAVSRYKIGDSVGVGCFVDSCRVCAPCQQSLQQYCEKGSTLTYNGADKEGNPTYGGYSTQIVVDEQYVLKIPSTLPLDQAAPLLCAGITTYSPLRTWKIKSGDKVGIVGLGGLGHMGVKLAAAMGAEVTVLSTSLKKKEDAMRMGAKNFVITKEPDALQKYANYFDLIINTAAGNIDLNTYLGLLKLDGTMVTVGIPEKPDTLNAFPLIHKRRRLAGSLIGGTKETQEMLDFCGKHNIVSDVEVISIDKINEAYDRMVKGDSMAIKIAPHILLDESELHFTFIRAPGPGGQNVNKVASAVQLRFNVVLSPSLPTEVKERIILGMTSRLTQEGEILIKASRHRTQERNKQDAINRLVEMLIRVAIPPKKRKKTKPTYASKQKRLEKKKKHSKTKKLRGKSMGWD